MSAPAKVVIEQDGVTVTVRNEYGPRGQQGIQGLKGDKGDTGDQGIPGEQGEQGETGPQPPLSAATPTPIVHGVAASAGSATDASKGDHTHHIRAILHSPLEYRFVTGGLPPTMQGRISGNSTTPGASTIMYITYETDANSISHALRLRGFESGMVLYLQDRTDETKWSRWLCTGAPTDVPASRRVNVPVSFIDASTTGAAGQQILLFVI